MNKFYNETLLKLETAINELEIETDCSIQRIEAVIQKQFTTSFGQLSYLETLCRVTKIIIFETPAKAIAMEGLGEMRWTW